ncbi:MAG: hypothetical protein M0Z94_04495 [Dehalococcoidales bacterium]|nr:hypothetical protein [Dehalococcoidales bacterium]
MKPIRILQADGHAITREATRRLLESEPDLGAMAEATNWSGGAAGCPRGQRCRGAAGLVGAGLGAGAGV